MMDEFELYDDEYWNREEDDNDDLYDDGDDAIDF